MVVFQPRRSGPLQVAALVLLGWLVSGAGARADMLIPVMGDEQAAVEQILGSAPKGYAPLPDLGPCTVYRSHGDWDPEDGDRDATWAGRANLQGFAALTTISFGFFFPIYPETYSYHSYIHPVTTSFTPPRRKPRTPPDDPYLPPDPPFKVTPEPGSLMLAVVGSGVLGLARGWRRRRVAAVESPASPTP
jgi:hypothetical protein